MTDSTLIAALRRIMVETGSLACLGCGHEHSCGTRGCAIMRAAADRLAAYEDTGLAPEDVKAALTPKAVINLGAQALGLTPDRLRALAMADREGRCVVLPPEDYTFTIRGDLALGIITANCDAYAREAALGGGGDG